MRVRQHGVPGISFTRPMPPGTLPIFLTASVLLFACGARTDPEAFGHAFSAGPSEDPIEAPPPVVSASASSPSGGDQGPSCTSNWHPCVERAECCSGMCVNGSCYACRQAGASCTANGECCSESCEAGHCGCSNRGGPHAICKNDEDCCDTVCETTTSMCELR